MYAIVIIITSIILASIASDAIENYRLCKRYEQLEAEMLALENARFEALEKLMFD